MTTAFCGKTSHDNQKIKYLCIDPFCHNSEKLGILLRLMLKRLRGLFP